MGYSIYEWFSDHGLPTLKKALKEIEGIEKKRQEAPEVVEQDEKGPYDVFREALQSMVSGYSPFGNSSEMFRSELFRLLFDENLELHDLMKEAFNLANDYEKEILTLEYISDNDLIRCDYNKIRNSDELS